MKEIEDASLTEAIHGYGRANNRNIGNSFFIGLINVDNNLSEHLYRKKIYLSIIIAPKKQWLN
jgi:hypothetical protein